MNITIKEVRKNKKVEELIKAADNYLEKIGYTEHGKRHADLTSRISMNILSRLGCSKKDSELAAIAGYLHDIGNLINRQNHAQSGALIASDVLCEMKMDEQNTVKIMAAIGNHEEFEAGIPFSDIAAAVILADKSDVHRTRVKKKNIGLFDIHDRVNYAVLHSFLNVDKKAKTVTLKITIDTKFSPIMEYFEIFLQRMLIMKKAAKALGCKFGLVINKTKIL